MNSSNDRPTKLNVGCGTQILPGWVNLDRCKLEGVDIVHDLDSMPWPFPDQTFSEIYLINVLEHLRNTVEVMEELYRLSRDNCKVTIRVPCINGPDAFSDPTHKSYFNQHTLDFFDPTTRHGRERVYYSKAKFKIDRRCFYARIIPGFPYLKISNPFLRLIMSALSIFMGGIIWSVEVEMTPLRQ